MAESAFVATLESNRSLRQDTFPLYTFMVAPMGARKVLQVPFHCYLRLVALPHGPLFSAAFLQDPLFSHPAQPCSPWPVRRRLRTK